MQVRNKHDTCEPFRPRKIVDSLIKEVDGIKEDEAKKIARSVTNRVDQLDVETIDTNEIRAMVQDQLTKRNEMEKARKYEILGPSIYEIEGLVEGLNRENANVSKNPESIVKYIHDITAKQYALKKVPSRVARAHLAGELHQHDQEFYLGRAGNCIQHSVDFFIRNGLKVDGNGAHTSVSGPPKHIESLVNMIGQVCGAGQVSLSGGQGVPALNTMLSPFVKGLSYEDVKQALQSLVFNFNHSYVSRGGQICFSNVQLDVEGVPEVLEDKPAYGPGGKVVGILGDFQDESRLINRAFTDILMDGDYYGKHHNFPNTIYTATKRSLKKEFEEDWLLIHELIAKYGTPYIHNLIPDWNGEYGASMGCRSRLNTNYTGDYDKDVFRTGNLAYITLNLPSVAYRSDGDWENTLRDTLDIAREGLLDRRERFYKQLYDWNLMPFLTQKDKLDGSDYYRPENATLSFGYCGLNEFVMASGIEEGLLSKDGQKIGIEILEYMNNYSKECFDDDGLRYTVIGSPAETTASRFSEIDLKRFGSKVFYQGTKKNSYYSNSSHLPVKEDVSLPERIKTEEQYHILSKGGMIFHAFLGEAHPDPESMFSLTKKIVKNTNIGFMGYTKDLSYCFRCHKQYSGIIDNCFECKKDDELESFSRITGYYSAIGRRKNAGSGWNDSKRQELKDRKRYNV